MVNKELLIKALRSNYERDQFIKGVLQPVFGSIVKIHSKAKTVEITQTHKKTIEKLEEYGVIELENGRLITLHEAILVDKVNPKRAKIGIADILRGHVAGLNGTLVNFISKESTSWRLTLIARDKKIIDGEVIEGGTEPSRYTYVLGPDESCKTIADRLVDFSLKQDFSMEKLLIAFEVEKLSDKFFAEYKYVHYNAFVQHLSGIRIKRKGKVDDFIEESNPSNFFNSPAFTGSIEQKHKKVRDFVKRLMGRILFLYFVQKKGWLKKWENGIWKPDLNFLENLFKECPDKENFYPVYLTKLFFHTLNKDESERPGLEQEFIKGQRCWIPYLNGGLFENDEPETDFIAFLPTIFEDFFHFLNQYNFTVDEDSPNDHTVAVDPEMLGHIFENLLEDNKEKGAYYTPKEIVQYMCQDALIQFLTLKLSTALNLDKKSIEWQELTEGIDLLIRKQHISKIDNYEKIILENLRDVKICDPAIGSGAFPMGLLHEIFQAVETINLITHDTVEDVWKLKNGWNAAQVKLAIIENSIYGVDIEKGAVDIARLRFWLSLIVDEEEPRPLPNLEYKIVQGNSLFSLFQQSLLEIDWSVDQSSSLRHEKEQIKEIFETLIDKESKVFKGEGNKKELQGEIREHKLDILLLQNEINKKKLVGEGKGNQSNIFGPDDKDKIVELTKKERLSFLNSIGHKLQQVKIDPKSTLEFFDWRLDFPDVLEVKKPGGFDIIIGNPPYHGEKFMSGQLAYIKNSVQWKNLYKRRSNIYYFFCYLSSKIGKDGSVVSFIIPREFQTAEWADLLRKYLANNSALVKIIDFEKTKVFADLGTSSLILTSVYSKSTIPDCVEVHFVDTNYHPSKPVMEALYKDWLKEENSLNVLGGKYWTFRYVQSSNTTTPVIKLGEIFEVSQGIVTGADRVTNKHVANSLISENYLGCGIFVLKEGQDIDANCTQLFFRSSNSWVSLNDEDRKCIKKYISSEHLNNFQLRKSDEFILIFSGDVITEILQKYLEQFATILVNRSKIIENTTITFSSFLKMSSKDIKRIYSSAGAVQKVMKKKKWYLPLYQRESVPFKGPKIIVNTKNTDTFTYTEDEVYSSGGGLGGQNYIYLKDESKGRFKSRSQITSFFKSVNLLLNSSQFQDELKIKGYNQLSTTKIKEIELIDLLTHADSVALIEFLAGIHDSIAVGKVKRSEIEKYYEALHSGASLATLMALNGRK